MQINSLVSIGIILLVIFLIYTTRTKEKFDQFASSINIPIKLNELSSINNIDISMPLLIDIKIPIKPNIESPMKPNIVSPKEKISYTTKQVRTTYGLISSTLVSPELNNFLYIDNTNIFYLKNKIINISKPIKINVTNITTQSFPIRLFFYNSTKDNLFITSYSKKEAVKLHLNSIKRMENWGQILRNPRIQ